MMRHVFMQAAMGGAIVMALLTAGLLVFGWLTRPAAASNRPVAARPKRQPAARPKPPSAKQAKPPSAKRAKPQANPEPKPKRRAKAALEPGAVPKPKPKLELVPVAEPDAPVAGPDLNGHSTESIDYPSWLAGTAELDADASELAELPAAGDDSGVTPSDPEAEIAAPSWLGLSDPLAEPDPPAVSATQALPDTEIDPPGEPTLDSPAPLSPAPLSPDEDESAWPDFLTLPENAEDIEDTEDTEPVDDPVSEPAAPVKLSEPDEPPGSAISPVALRMLGAARSGQPDEDGRPSQHHQVVLGDDQIDIILAEPATPNLAWTPLPYDIPEDGLAFACVGAGDEGCLFIDLAAAPGAVAITGDNDAAARLAESIAHQLGTNTVADRPISVLIVGGAIPEPHPATATSVPTLSDLTAARPADRLDGTDVVFCELHSTEEAFALARLVNASQHRVVPIVLGDLPGAAWSFTAYPSQPLDDDLLALDSAIEPSWQ
jgi:hypothetical protein